MGREEEAEVDRASTAFKNLVFASSVGPKVPDLYWTLFDEERGLTEEEEAQVEWVDQPMDIGSVLGELAAAGWKGD